MKNPTRPRGYYLWVTSDNKTFSNVKIYYRPALVKITKTLPNVGWKTTVLGKWFPVMFLDKISVGCILQPMSPMVVFLNPWIINRLGSIRLTPSCDSFWETLTGHLSLQDFFLSMSFKHIFSPRFTTAFLGDQIRADQCWPRHNLRWVCTKNPSKPRSKILWVTSNKKTFSAVKDILSTGVGNN